VPSVSRHLTRALALATCALLAAAALGGCATTQDTAALKQAESKRILEAREHKHQAKSHDHGSKQR
jgi:hypothetical protein